MRVGVGQSAERVEDDRLLRGRGRYTDDINLPDQLHGCVVRSPHPHACIAGIDAALALAAPGVVAVFTGADVEADGLGAKGAGEAGTVGGMPCVMSAILDALGSIGAVDFEMPATPE